MALALLAEFGASPRALCLQGINTRAHRHWLFTANLLTRSYLSINILNAQTCALRSIIAMANVTIPPAGAAISNHSSNERRTDAVASRALAHEAALAERAEEQARTRRAALDAPWYTEQLDPNNFGANEFLDPQHIAMFNGTAGGRRAASFPERTLDTGLHFNPTPSALSPSGASERDIATPLHPEILTDIILDLWTPSTSYGALGQALGVATDAPPSIACPAEPPLTISPPLDSTNLPEVPPESAPEGSSRAKRQADWAAQGDPANPTTGQPAGQPKDDAAQKRQRDEAARQKREAEEKRQRDEAAKK
ncbi:MAG: hypothetical protein DMF62_03565 [Acidobacteria bacterium]|nr:MAG: hypothetical protein DMF62_03565 [Acidobacteriota bacterium]